MSLGARLKTLRLRNEESLQDVADAVKVSKAHMWDLESGNSKNPSLELLRSLAGHFQVSVATLVGEAISDSDDAAMVMFRELQNLTESDQKVILDVIESMKKRREAEGGNKDKSD